MHLTIEQIARATSSYGDFEGFERVAITRVQTDSRLVQEGDLFVCIAGQRYDGHNFAREAVRKGAAAILAHTPLLDIAGAQEVPVLLVEDTVKALGRLALYVRQRTRARVIGITGSAGKTTTKEFLSSVLSQKARVGKNYKNWNNQLGLPLSILNFDGQEDYWVLELGISNPEDMDELGSILRPDIVIITNIGPCHLEGLGSVLDVASYKTKILDYLQNESWAVLNKDYPALVKEARKRQQIKQYLFSCSDKKQKFRGEYHGCEGDKGRYEIGINGENYYFTLPWIGAHLTENITAVAVLAHLLGYSGSEVEQGLCQARIPEQRLCLWSEGEWTIIDDTYNANPLSMRAAIRTAAELAKDRDLVLVLGDMAELGTLTEEEHRKLGEFIRKIDCNYVFFHGQHADYVKAGLSASEGWPGEFFICYTPEDFFSFFKSLNLKNAVVLFKGSRSCKMEEYVRMLARAKD